MSSQTRKSEVILVRIIINKGVEVEKSFADTCAKITQEATIFLGNRMSKCFIVERSVSATLVNLCFTVYLKSSLEPHNFKTSILRQLQSDRVGIPEEIFKRFVTIDASKGKRTNMSHVSQHSEFLPNSSKWQELHSLIAEEASVGSRIEPFESKNPFSPLADTKPSESSQSNEEPMCVDDESTTSGIKIESSLTPLPPDRMFCSIRKPWFDVIHREDLAEESGFINESKFCGVCAEVQGRARGMGPR